MKQQADVKARVVLIVWNLMLTVAVIAMSFRLAQVGAETNAVFEEQLVLMEEMVETDKRHSVLIADLFGYVDNVQKLGLSDNTRITSNDYAIKQIYRLHIIPLRAFHMENFDE